MSRTLVSESEFPLYVYLHDWAIHEVPFGYQCQMAFLPRHSDLITLFISGCQTTPQYMHDELVTVGMDVIAHEPHPKTDSRYGPEPRINIYHVVGQKLARKYGDYQYLFFGPFNTGSLQSHWPKSEDAALNFYCHLATPLRFSSQ
jgi:hypothetical protein